jgi:hypothetical protein
MLCVFKLYHFMAGIKHMFNSYEYMVNGDFCTINKCETDDELVESVKCMKEISFCHSQYSTITICQSKGVCCNNADDVLSHF